MAILRRAFNLAVEDGAILTAPKVPMATENNVRQGKWTDEEIELVANHDHVSPVVGDLIRFANVTGWREQEIKGITVDQVLTNEGIIRLEPGTTKNGEGREFPYVAIPRLREVVERRLAAVAALRKAGMITPLLFHWEPKDLGKTGATVGRHMNQINKARKALGLAPRTFHDLRRSAVRYFDAAEVSPDVARSFSGHKTASIYSRYNIVDRKVQKTAGEKLNAFLTVKRATA